ncbi:MAG: CPBP family intramembrane metalloprotease [Marinisporobacter sp.]|nr:CPBP family intramembrane metalloprotease [Marinisporobacter sp.]
MNKRRFIDNMATTIIITLIYTIYFYVVIKFIIENNMRISINNITIDNIGTKLIGDFCLMLLIPLILIVINRKRLIEFKLQFLYSCLQYILIAIMVLLFFIHGDFTIRGYYKFFFFLVVVAFGEEFIFRGYVYNKLLIHNKIFAILISGFFWGILHAILPGLLVGDSIWQIGIRMLNEIGAGIVFGYYFIYLLEKSKSLFIPIFVHAILDYTIGYIGILTAIGTGIYLFILDRKKIQEQL